MRCLYGASCHNTLEHSIMLVSKPVFPPAAYVCRGGTGPHRAGIGISMRVERRAVVEMEHPLGRQPKLRVWRVTFPSSFTESNDKSQQACAPDELDPSSGHHTTHLALVQLCQSACRTMTILTRFQQRASLALLGGAGEASMPPPSKGTHSASRLASDRGHVARK